MAVAYPCCSARLSVAGGVTVAMLLTATIGRAVSGDALPVEEIAPGVFVYSAPYELAGPDNDGAIANVGFIIGSKAIAVIDTGNSRRVGQRLLAAVRERSSLSIRYVINTHMHPDHVLGNAAFLAEEVRFVGHHKLPRALAARADSYLEGGRRSIGQNVFAGSEIVLPDILVEDLLVLDLGGRELELEAHRTAHTDNDLTVLDRMSGTWFLGDLLFVGHVPVIDGSLLGWLDVIEDVGKRQVRQIVPGHGPASVPHPSSLDPQRRYLERLAADVRRTIKAGGTMSEAAETAAASEAPGWSLFNQFNARNAIAAFHELEWE